MNEIMSPAERWVLKQVQSGEVADLQEKFPAEKDRALSARFLEDLMTDSLEGVHVHRKGVRIKHAVLTQPLDLEGAEIPHETRLENCRFDETITLENSRFRKNLVLRESSFRKGINLGRADIAGFLSVDEAKFTNEDHEANFNSMKVGSSAFLRKVAFAGPVNFGHANIVGVFLADGAKFTSEDKEANFYGMKVGNIAFFTKAVFAGPVNFGDAEISGQFLADGAQFTSEDKAANFYGMKVSNIAFFRNAVFAGPVSFGGAEISSQFVVVEAKFTNAKQVAIFNSMKVGETAFFRDVVFAGQVSMQDAGFLDLSIERAKSGDDAQEGCRLDLSRALIRRELIIKDMRLRTLTTTSLRVEGPALLSGVVIENEASLEHSDFLTLNLAEVSWPDDSESVKLDGIKYEHIAAGEGKDSWKKLLALANLSRYNSSVYADLEAFFKRQGHPERANEVFVAQKRRERKEILQGRWRKLWSYFLDYSVRYGRSPGRAFRWSVPVIVIGCVVFWSRQNMEPQRAEDVARHYSAFLYSLDLFIPFIDLKAASVWIPKPDCWFAQIWMRAQIIFGWILIPTGLAAWTGIIK